MNYLTSEEFRKSPSSNVGVRKDCAVVVKADAGKPVRICVSTETADRMGDTVAVAGWKLDAFKRNPVVLWAHDRKELPVGRATRIWTEGGRLMAEVEFTPKEVNPFGYSVGELVKAGFLSASSVGFRPVKYAQRADGGVDFIEQELLEFSIVPVPANAEALLDGKCAVVDYAKIAKMAETEFLAQYLASLVAPAVAANYDAILAAIEGR